jgi:2-polyprenyl-3-methyl-5-hydroxy-6-metoxy-1,4-benzoquinol methylase
MAASDTATGDARFGFGKNWSRFAEDLPDASVEAAKRSLAEMLGQTDLANVTFLDVGSGSGLFSLSAALLGAERVHSLDYDADSVATTARLKERFAPQADWTVERASALDAGHMDSLGQWDVVYSWGVLHHTGNLWSALELTCARVARGGRLFISIYNDQGWASRAWTRVKRFYNAIPIALRVPYTLIVMAPMEVKSLFRSTLKLRPGEYFRGWLSSGDRDRGMSRWHDMVDWVGGYPFEVATPEEVFEFCAARGFVLRKLRTAGGEHGCNEFVFELTGFGDRT